MAELSSALWVCQQRRTRGVKLGVVYGPVPPHAVLGEARAGKQASEQPEPESLGDSRVLGRDLELYTLPQEVHYVALWPSDACQCHSQRSTKSASGGFVRSVSRLGWKLWLQVTLARTANIASAAKDWQRTGAAFLSVATLVCEGRRGESVGVGIA